MNNKIKNKKKLFSSFLFLLIISLVMSGCSGPGKYDAFAQCLTDNGVAMYGMDWCKYCQSQKEIFGKSFEYVTYINCDKSRFACDEAGVTGYPTWVIDGNDYGGVQQLYKLAQLTGCGLEGSVQ